MTPNQIRDYKCSLDNHILPYFGKMPFSAISPTEVKKFVAQLKDRKNRYGEAISPKTILNYLIPFREIIRDAQDEYGWYDMVDPFRRLRLPKQRKKRIQPLSFEEWPIVREHLFEWYRPYFEFALQTGLRPSEQVALKWSAVDDRFIHVELSRVRNVEKADLKTQGSFRQIELRPNMKRTLEQQWELTRHMGQPYVFVTTQGLAIRQENLGKVWTKALKKAGLAHRTLYQCRHTFATWALGAGESPQWVARTLGHVDTTMVYRVYGRFVPNLTRQDGSAFEQQFTEVVDGKGKKKEARGHKWSHGGHNHGHNRKAPKITR